MVTVAALTARLLVGDGAATAATNPEQMSYPVTYWNALGFLAGVGIVLCLHLASSLREPLWVRAAGAASLPVLASTLLLTLSRGALWCTALGLVVYLVVSHPRGLPVACVAALPIAGPSRLTSQSNNNRVSKWRIAYEEWQRHPLKGTGAGTYVFSWQRERATEGHVRGAQGNLPRRRRPAARPHLRGSRRRRRSRAPPSRWRPFVRVVDSHESNGWRR